MARTSWIAVVALLGACQSQETPEQAQVRMGKEADALRTTAGTIARRWEGWIAAGQGDSVATVFTEDGREMPPNRPAVVGRPAITKFETDNAAVFAAKLSLRTEAVVANGPLGIERGSYTYSSKARPKAPKGTPASVTDDGKYVVYWRNVNNQWLIGAVIWNSNMPMAMPTPSKKAAHPAAKKPAKKKK